MQTAQIELKSSGLFSELAGKVVLQVNALLCRMALQARIKQERKQLLEMPDYLLKDMGITREQALAEASRQDLPGNRC